jgi:uncharacterized protein YndB with AHSA1/START domain
MSQNLRNDAHLGTGKWVALAPEQANRRTPEEGDSMTDRNVTHATFTMERIYGVSPELVFNAWADPEVKARWFAGGASDYKLDFRPGGLERNSTTLDGKQITWEALYCDIVDKERIVYTSLLREGNMVATASLTTVELVPGGDGTHLILVECGAYLDGREKPAWREQGTGKWLDALGKDLARQARD